jgi:hypothetical protein
MAFIFPLSLAAFFDKAHVKTISLTIANNQEYTGLGSGQILTAQKAPPAWIADVSMSSMEHDYALELQAIIESLDGSIGSFYLYDPRKIYPKAYPNGTGLVIPAGGIKINSIGANNKSISLKNAMANQVFSAGDLFHFDYATGPVRRAFHRIIETSSANGSGTTPVFEIRPHLRVGVAVDQVVTVIKPSVKMQMIPGTFVTSNDTEVSTTISFSARQTI